MDRMNRNIRRMGGMLALAFLALASTASALVIDQESGKDYIVFEAEAADEILNPDAANDVQNSVQTGSPENPARVWAPVAVAGTSGGTVLVAPPSPHRAQTDSALQESIAVYRLRFATAGTYKLYILASNNGTAGNGSSDSVWVATAFGAANPTSSAATGNGGGFAWITGISTSFAVAAGDLGNALEVRIGVRENDARIDALIMSTDTGLGAAELNQLLNGGAIATPTPLPTPTGTPPPGVVSTVAEFDAALMIADPGDTIVMRSGFWQDATLVFTGHRSRNGTGGTSDALPITLRGEQPGKTILTCASSLKIAGDYMVVTGLKFEDGTLPGGYPIVEFRDGSSRLANNCRLTQSAIIDYNPASASTDYDWVSVYGLNNRIDHCWFSGMNHIGVQLVVWPAASGPANRTRIDNNYFGDRTLGTDNGYETIRIGTSDVSNRPSEAVVERNLFLRCDGEIETISNKSVGNVYRGNTFRETLGQLTLRHGSACIVDQNFFFGAGKPDTSGVRIVGPDHVVTNNYFEGMRGTNLRATVALMNGVPSSPLNRYQRVERALIAFNTFVDCQEAIVIGNVSSRGDATLAPLDNTIANNVMQLSGSQRAYKYVTPPLSTAYEGNLWFGGTLGISTTTGITQASPLLARAADGLMRPHTGSPAIGGAAGSYPTVIEDMDGQPRADPKDAGADQAGSGPIEFTPLTPQDVGPDWMKSGVSFSGFVISGDVRSELKNAAREDDILGD